MYVIEDSDRAAEWLPPWTGGSRLLTLWDMKEYLVHRLVSVSSRLTDCWIIAGINFDHSKQLEAKDRAEVVQHLQSMESELRFLGLEQTRILSERMRGTVAKHDINYRELGAALGKLDERLEDEVQPLRLFYVSPDKLRFYQSTNLFGDEFKANFQTANAEVIEAGNCFAFGRYTACVYHLTRATEIVLRVLFVSLGMPPRVWSTTKWSKLLDRVKGKIDKNNRTLADDMAWQKDRPFYESAHAFLAAIRVPVRNPTVHVESVYDEGGAENVFDAVKAFMRHVATKLKE
jgi:hypothetical protein